MNAESPTPSMTQVLKRWSTGLLILGTLLITLSGIGLWIEWTLLSERGFISISTGVLRADETRETIATAVVDIMFEEQPVLRTLVRDPIEGVITGLLGSSIFNTALEFVSEVFWEVLFIGRDRVALNIEPLQDFVYAILSVIAPDTAASIEPEQLPSELVLLEGNELPDLGNVASVASWVSIFAFLIGVSLTAGVISRNWANRSHRAGLIAWTGIFLVTEALLIAITTLPIRSTLVLSIDNASGRSLIATTYGILVLRLYIILIGLSLFGCALTAWGLWIRGYQPGRPGTEISSSGAELG